MRHRRPGLGAAALAALGGAVALALARFGAAPAPPDGRPAAALLRSTPSHPGVAAHLPDAAAGLAPAPGVADPGAPLPASLRGLDVDGDLFVDAAGHFRATVEARRLFDHFLAASGEETPERLRARIVAEIRRRLAPPASDEAVALLDRYLAYRDAVRELFERGEAPADLERRWQWLRELRRATLGAADARAFFAEEEERVARALERRRVALDPELAPDERARRLEALDAERPDAEREALRRATAHLRLARDEAALREAGASGAEIHALRAERFGEEAAERLDALDARRADWERRLATYREDRAALLARAPRDPAARAAALDALRREHFSPAEARRAAALDRLEAAKATD